MDQVTASEDFSTIPDAFGAPYCYWGLGGFVEGRETFPNHSPFFAPDPQPTLATGSEAALTTILGLLAADGAAVRSVDEAVEAWVTWVTVFSTSLGRRFPVKPRSHPTVRQIFEGCGAGGPQNGRSEGRCVAAVRRGSRWNEAP